MNAIRAFLQKHPWIGWVIALGAIGFAVAMAFGVFDKPLPDSTERLSQEVTIRCTETGNTWTMSRGEFERMLMMYPGQIDPEAGIPSPYADGRLTGVLVDDDDWRETVSRINREKKKYE